MITKEVLLSLLLSDPLLSHWFVVISRKESIKLAGHTHVWYAMFNGIPIAANWNPSSSNRVDIPPVIVRLLRATIDQQIKTRIEDFAGHLNSSTAGHLNLETVPPAATFFATSVLHTNNWKRVTRSKTLMNSNAVIACNP